MTTGSRFTVWTAALGAAVLLAGCSGTRSTYVPDGRRGFVVKCGGLMGSSAACMVKAGRACGNHGYDIIRGNDEDGQLLIACKVPPIPPSTAAASH